MSIGWSVRSVWSASTWPKLDLSWIEVFLVQTLPSKKFNWLPSNLIKPRRLNFTSLSVTSFWTEIILVRIFGQAHAVRIFLALQQSWISNHTIPIFAPIFMIPFISLVPDFYIIYDRYRSYDIIHMIDTGQALNKLENGPSSYWPKKLYFESNRVGFDEWIELVYKNLDHRWFI